MNRISSYPEYGIVTPLRLFAAWYIAENWRLHKRCPRLAAFSKRLGIPVVSGPMTCYADKKEERPQLSD